MRILIEEAERLTFAGEESTMKRKIVMVIEGDHGDKIRAMREGERMSSARRREINGGREQEGRSSDGRGESSGKRERGGR